MTRNNGVYFTFTEPEDEYVPTDVGKVVVDIYCGEYDRYLVRIGSAVHRRLEIIGSDCLHVKGLAPKPKRVRVKVKVKRE